MAGKSPLCKEQNKNRRETNQFKKNERRERKRQNSQSEFMPHGNQYRRKRQEDREHSYDEEFDLY